MSKVKTLKFIFVSHESSLSGAPILLVNFLRLLKQNEFKFSIVLKRGGELEKKFAEVGKTFILKPQNYQTSKFYLVKIFDYLRYRIRLFFILKEIKTADVIFSNTITNGRFLEQISFVKKPILTYVHELEWVIQYYNKNNDSNLSLALSSAFCCPNVLISDNLLANHNTSKETIFPLNYYFPPVREDLSLHKTERQNIFFKKYGIPFDKFYVVGMGTATFRKGIDLFIEACDIIRKIDAEIYFVWIGDYVDNEEKQKIEEQLKQSNVTDFFTLTGFIPNDPYNLLPFDILALTSREDPYPLVVLEAAFLKIPAIAFREAGGMGDFIGKDAGFLLGKQSAELVAEKILFLKRNDSEVTKKGTNAFQKAADLHSNPSLVLNQLDAAVNYAINNSNISKP